MKIKNLELRAQVVVEGFFNGLHRSPYHGFSVEFTEYRQYVPGDDPRYLDWDLYARTDRFFIKKFEDETNLRCHFVVDQSRSMEYGSGSYSKTDYANTLAATLARLLYLQGDAVGLLSFDEAVREYLPARHRKSHLRQLMHALERPAAGRATRIDPPLKRIVELVKRRGMIVVISDFLTSVDNLEPHLSRARAAGHEVLVFQVLDPKELHFDFDQAALFQETESENDVYVDPELIRKEYLKKLEAHNQAIRKTCMHLGIAYLQLSSSDPFEIALIEFLRERMSRGRLNQKAIYRKRNV